jgi:hypothetical protein
MKNSKIIPASIPYPEAIEKLNLGSKLFVNLTNIK